MTTATKSSPRLRAVPALPPAPPAAPRAPRVRKPKLMVTGVVEQVRLALQPKNRLATLMGFLLGGIVPLASFVVAHYEVDVTRPLYSQLGVLLVLGGLVYSAKTVYDWGKRAFKSPAKAMGFVILLEGVMIAADTSWLGIVALSYLIVINGVATGCNLALPRALDQDQG